MAEQRKKTAYHVLRKLEGTGTRFELVGTDIEASNGPAAVRIFAEKVAATPTDGGSTTTAVTLAGTYVPVPSRSFAEIPVEVETKTVVTLGSA